MSSQPLISFICIFHNMQREAPRTLKTLSEAYQSGERKIPYEVIAIDNGSDAPIDESLVKSFGAHWSYHYYETRSPSPVEAVNWGVGQARGEFVAILIDGARMLSPGVVDGFVRAISAYDTPFVFTLGLHLGPKVQNESILEGYGRNVEDAMLSSINWEENGYALFQVSSLAGSSSGGYFGTLSESNCVCLNKSTFKAIGGMNAKFQSPGGGLVNLDFFDRCLRADGVSPVMLLGEASFHQIHGGVATNVPRDEHPKDAFKKEYFRIYNCEYSRCNQIDYNYIGRLPSDARRFK